MLGRNDLENQVDKYLKSYAKLEDKRKKIIDLFNEQYSKKEVKSSVDYLLQNMAETYAQDLLEFIVHYESTDKDVFTIKDIRTYITLSKVYKKQMKEPKTNNSSLDTHDEQKENAEGNYE